MPKRYLLLFMARWHGIPYEISYSISILITTDYSILFHISILPINSKFIKFQSVKNTSISTGFKVLQLRSLAREQIILQYY